jgi:predicted TPR repeat methyltransferase
MTSDEPTTPTGGNPYLKRAYGLRGPDDARAFYDEWAAEYDADLADDAQGYVAPELAAETLVRVAGTGVTVLDAGCGTGLVGVALAARGFGSVDGLDLSRGMIRQARRRRVYHDLGPADLRRGVPGARAKFGVVTCVGALVPGHLGPGALIGFARAVVAGGYVVAAIPEDTWTDAGYDAQVAGLAEQGYASPVAGVDGPDPDGPGRLLVLQVPR